MSDSVGGSGQAKGAAVFSASGKGHLSRGLWEGRVEIWGRAGGSSICKGPEGVLPGASRLTEEAAWGAEVLWGVRDHRLTQGLCGKGRRGAPAAFERRRDGGRCTFLMLSLMAGTSAACELGSLEVSVHRGRS